MFHDNHAMVVNLPAKVEMDGVIRVKRIKNKKGKRKRERLKDNVGV